MGVEFVVGVLASVFMVVERCSLNEMELELWGWSDEGKANYRDLDGEHRSTWLHTRVLWGLALGRSMLAVEWSA